MEGGPLGPVRDDHPEPRGRVQPVTGRVGERPEDRGDQFLLDPRRLTVAVSRAKRKMILVAAETVFSIFSPDEETFAHSQLWKNLLRRTCTTKLWEGEPGGTRVEVWGN